MIQKYINHIAFVLDGSSSMDSLSEQTVKLFDNQIAHLASRSKELDQETRISLYVFADDVKCLLYDQDACRLPSLKGHYHAYGNTNLTGGTLQAIEDLKLTPEIYGDHSFLVFVQTDGMCNRGLNLVDKLSKTIKDLKDNWTIAVMVPNQLGVSEAKKFGFPAQNISVWDINSVEGLEESVKTIRESTDLYMTNRSKGIRGTKSLFSLDTTNLSTKVLKKTLTEINPNDYNVIIVRKKEVIKPLVESWLKVYRVGSAYYQLTKPETVQRSKNIHAAWDACGLLSMRKP